MTPVKPPESAQDRRSRRPAGKLARKASRAASGAEDAPRKLTGDGYVNVRLEPGSWELEHRLVAARALGVKREQLGPVRHRNGKRDDNRPENLYAYVLNDGWRRCGKTRRRPDPLVGLRWDADEARAVLGVLAVTVRQARREGLELPVVERAKGKLNEALRRRDERMR